jgi:glutathione peroxidase-family protein
MLIEIIKITTIDCKNRRHHKRMSVCRCDGDYCCNMFQSFYKKRYINTMHFCCQECQNLSQKRKEKIKQTFYDRYNGTTILFDILSRGQKNMSPEKKQLKKDKTQKTCLEKYGVEHPWQKHLKKYMVLVLHWAHLFYDQILKRQC